MVSSVISSFAGYTGYAEEVNNQFSINATNYNIIYDLSDGSWNGTDIGISQYNSSNYGYVPPTPVKKGYVFTGWSPASITTGTKGDIKFTATWRRAVAVLESGKKFNAAIKTLVAGSSKMFLDGDSLISSIQVISNGKIPSGIDTVEVQDTSSDYVISAYAIDNDSSTKDIYLICDADEIYLNTDSSNIFRYLSSLTSLDLSNFNTSNVTDASYMIYMCANLTSIDLSNFNTSNITNMAYMFCGDNSLTDLDLSNFDTSKVTKMTDMFGACISLTDLDLSNFDTRNVTDMTFMFAYCYKLKYLDLSNFDMNKVTSKSSMLSNTASTSKSCTVVCTEDTETALKSGTSITESYFTFVRSLTYASSLSLDMNDDSGEVYTISSFN
jgi:uncharacterized repeat protein (TIGR02543 family)